jgi:hypothetical protein
MTGREAFTSMLEGRNMLRVRQSSDIALFEYCDESALRAREKKKDGSLAVSTGGRNYGHQMIAREKENTLGEDEKGEGLRVVARHRVYLQKSRRLKTENVFQ